MNHPIDIAYALDLLTRDVDNYKSETESELREALYQIKAIAENKNNPDYWRTFYSVLSAIADIPELSGLPF